MRFLIVCGLMGVAQVAASITAAALPSASKPVVGPMIRVQAEPGTQRQPLQKRARGGAGEQQVLQNPMVQQILRDPELQQQILDDPRFESLMQDPQVQRLLQAPQVQRQMQQNQQLQQMFQLQRRPLPGVSADDDD
jgi:hypothetical protein